MTTAAPPRSTTAPPSSRAPHPADDDDMDSNASSLYARCMAGVSRSLNARRLRQAADNDVLFLQNRIHKLKDEEMRARLEIQKLRQKTEEVSANRERYVNGTAQRRALQDQVDYGKRKEAALIALNKERQAKAVWSSKQRVMLDRREAVLAMRKQKEINECRVHIIKEEQRDKHTRQRETIRQLHAASKTRREREAETRREEVRSYYEQRIAQEQLDRERKEKLAAQLVAQEAQLIYRLKTFHTEKQDALKALARTVEESGSMTLPPISSSSIHNSPGKGADP